MRNEIAKFEKVSLAQFEKDWTETFGKCPDAEILKNYNLILAPRRATKGSCGYDLYSPIDITLEPGQTIKIPTGLKCFIEDYWFMMAVPRSGQGFKYGLRLANTTGIIDSDYYKSDNEGHIFVKLINDSSIGKTVHIKTGEAFAQVIFVQFGVTYDDYSTVKRNGGLGSTSR